MSNVRNRDAQGKFVPTPPELAAPNNGLTLEEVVALFKTNDPIRWHGARSKKRVGHQGEGTFQGTLNGKILVRYRVSARYAMHKTATVEHTLVILDDQHGIAA